MTEIVCSKWQTPQRMPKLADDEAHIWLANLSVPESSLAIFLASLTDDEKDRANRFIFQKDRDHFIAARGTLRAVLSRYLQIDADRLRFCYNSYGKPALIEGTNSANLRFNVSHSHGLGLFAVTHHREIGVDIEHIRPDFAGPDIAERFFSANEVAALRNLAESEQVEGFFNCWVRKEAYIKAKGKGLSIPLDQFEVSLTTGESEVTLRTASDSEEPALWKLYHLSPALDYTAAVAIQGTTREIKFWRSPVSGIPESVQTDGLLAK